MNEQVTMQGLLNAQVELHKKVENSGDLVVDRRASAAALAALDIAADDLNVDSVVITETENATVIDRSATADALRVLGETPCEERQHIEKKTINQLIDEAPHATIFDLTTPEHLLACHQTIVQIREDQTERMTDADMWVAGFAGLLGGVVELFVGGVDVAKCMSQSGLNSKGIKSLESNHHVSYDAANSGHIKKDWSDLTGVDKKRFANAQEGGLGALTKEYKQAFAHNKNLYDQGAFDNLNCKGHHFDSPAHDILGVTHAIRDQIEGTCTIYSPKLGEMVTVMNPGSQMSGGYTVENIVKAAINFFGHIMSDINGSGTTAGAGAGLGFPGYSIVMNSAGISSGATDLAREAYLQGYDFREWLSQGLAVAIPRIVLWIWKKLTGVSDIVYNRMCAIAYGVITSVSIAKMAYGDFRLNYMAVFLFANHAVKDILYWMRLEDKRRAAVHNHIMDVLKGSTAPFALEQAKKQLASKL